MIVLLVNTKKPPTTQTLLVDFDSIKPGDSNRAIVEKSLGRPLSSDPMEGGTIDKYRSDNKYWTNDVHYEGDAVRLTIKKILPPQDFSFSRRTSKIGELPIPLYGDDSNIGIILYVYPQAGIAILANKEQDIMYEEWKFVSVDISSFLRFPEARGYSLEKNSGKPDL